MFILNYGFSEVKNGALIEFSQDLWYHTNLNDFPFFSDSARTLILF